MDGLLRGHCHLPRKCLLITLIRPSHDKHQKPWFSSGSIPFPYSIPPIPLCIGSIQPSGLHLPQQLQELLIIPSFLGSPYCRSIGHRAWCQGSLKDTLNLGVAFLAPHDMDLALIFDLCCGRFSPELLDLILLVLSREQGNDPQ